KGVKIYIEKNIPDKAGLAGGSSNAAAVLIGLNEIYNTKLDNKSLIEISKNIGADIPFCIVGGTCYVTGIGDIVKPLKQIDNMFFVIAKCDYKVSTKIAFETIDKLNNEVKDISKNKRSSMHEFINKVNLKNLNEIENNLYNDFEKIITEQVIKVKDDFYNLCNKKSLMTGSGSAVFAVFDKYEEALNCFYSMKKIYNKTYLVKPLNRGVDIIKKNE
ncbi:MAG: 4-(cytidine 5'-diphospho)-2-C-methyl-D-erythritol kinase, partial [Oscillospiraceae bacterium]